MGMNKWASQCFKTLNWVHKHKLKINETASFQTALHWRWCRVKWELLRYITHKKPTSDFLSVTGSHMCKQTEENSDCKESICRQTLWKTLWEWQRQSSWHNWTVSLSYIFLSSALTSGLFSSAVINQCSIETHKKSTLKR